MAFPTPATKTNCDASTDDPKQALLVDLATLVDKFNLLLAAAAAAGPLAASGITGAAPLDSPALTGVPTGPTAAAGTNTTQLANTAFVISELSSAIKAGTIVDFSGATAPAGYLACPTSPTNISRTTYAALFAAIGTQWGAGDGSTTFGMPWYPADYTGVQANANVGTSTVGQVLSHNHPQQGTSSTAGSGSPVSATPAVAGSAIYVGGAPVLTPMYATTANTGGTANLPAGQRILKCVKY